MTVKLTNDRDGAGIPLGDLESMLAELEAMFEKLESTMVVLTPKDRQRLPKMRSSTVEFVDKVGYHMRATPHFKPAFLDIEEFERKRRTVRALQALLMRLDQVRKVLDDSRLQCSSVVYTEALASYKSFKAAAKLGLPGADLIVRDVARSFPGRRTAAAMAAAQAAGQSAPAADAA